jgi:phage/plasmid primase-like uncharacterized protein
MEWPTNFVSMADPLAAPGAEYVKSRGLSLDGDMYYDIDRKGIAFPYYFGGHFCGAQVRFITPWLDKDGNKRKIDTIPGTRLGLLFYGWDQGQFPADVKFLVVVEGAFNALSINQAFAETYGGITKSPWRAVACSGSGATKHQREAMKELSNNGLKIIIAPDRDEAGLKMLEKFLAYNVTNLSAIPPETDKDWNDYFKELGPKAFAEWFLSRIKSV